MNAGKKNDQVPKEDAKVDEGGEHITQDKQAD
jgi:hypothetical protein